MSTKKENHVVTSLQDFARTVGVPSTVKRDNFKTQTGEKWKEVECNLCIKGKMTGPHSPWQNVVEHGIGDLGTTATECMGNFGVPLRQQH